MESHEQVEHISYGRPIEGLLPDLTAPSDTGCRCVLLWELMLSSRPCIQEISSFMLDFECKFVVMKSVVSYCSGQRTIFRTSQRFVITGLNAKCF